MRVDMKDVRFLAKALQDTNWRIKERNDPSGRAWGPPPKRASPAWYCFAKYAIREWIHPGMDEFRKQMDLTTDKN
jgi:hypothetical protein